ncbi:MAG: glycosyltransferase family 2 protein [Burkholderiales bacterium]
MSSDAMPQVSIAIPSLNQGGYLEQALESIAAQSLRCEILVADGGSTDCTAGILARWAPRLAWWRSRPDGGQSEAINEALRHARAPYVAWLNADDALLPGGLAALIGALETHPDAPAAYGDCLFIDAVRQSTGSYRTEEFDADRFAWRCFIAQPATLIRRSVWEALGGLDTQLQMAMDYDLWWRIYRRFGPLLRVRHTVAASRDHLHTKTNMRRAQHYREAIAVVRRHYGRVPIKWRLAWPVQVWARALRQRVRLAQHG